MTSLNLLDRINPANDEIVAQEVMAVTTSPKFEVMVSRTALLKGLSHLQGIVERRNLVPILSNVKLEVVGGLLELTATDMDLAVTEKIQAEIRHADGLTVPAHMLYDIVRKLPEGASVVLSTMESAAGKMEITSGSCKFSISFLAVADFPVMDSGRMTHEFLINAAQLITLIDKTRASISMEDGRYNLSGIYFHATQHESEQAIRAVATDGHRLSRVAVSLPEGASGMNAMILPRKTVMEVRKLIEGLEGEIKVAISPVKVKFSFDDVELTSKLIDGVFPDYELLIPTDNNVVMKVSTESFAKAVDRVSIITFEKLRAVTLRLEENKAIISAVGEANGSASEELAVEYSGNPMQAIFNAKYLLEMMSSISGDFAEFLFVEGMDGPALIKDSDNAEVLHVIMPISV